MDIRIDPFWNWSEFLCSNDNFLQRLADDGVDCDSLGYVALDIKNRDKNWKYKALPFIIDKSKHKNDSLYNELYSNYSVLANLTQNEGAKLILISTPLYKTYHQFENPELYKELRDFVKKLHQEYSCVSYYDLSNLDILNDDDFNDASHLTKTGAIKFSKLLHSIINEEIQNSPKSHIVTPSSPLRPRGPEYR